MLVNALGIPEHYIEFADEDEMGPVTGIVGGFTGPVEFTTARSLSIAS